jgi:hypothetical protein
MSRCEEIALREGNKKRFCWLSMPLWIFETEGACHENNTNKLAETFFVDDISESLETKLKNLKKRELFA